MIDYTLHYKDEFDPKIVEDMKAKAFQQLKKERLEDVSGYYELPHESLALVDEVLAHARTIKPFDTVAVIGIGGSSLGSKALDALLHYQTDGAKKMVFFENPDPIDISQKFQTIQKEKTLFIVISKSGSTIETTSIFKAIIKHFNLSLEHNEHLIAITDKDSALYDFAKLHSIKTFTLKQSVGGRFSVLSSVGIVPLTLAGLDTTELLRGAKEMSERFFAGDADYILQKAAYLVLQEQSINVVFSYSNLLKEFTEWYVQLWGESLGKKNAEGVHLGLTPVGHIGSVDQHSFLQLIIEGPRDKSVTFIKIADFENSLAVPDISLKNIEKTDYINGHSFNELINAECDATMQSVSDQGINVDIITLDKISAYNAGELLFYYELLTSGVGAMLGINTYNQEGVELGKRILVNKFNS
jgi:glucose-6-phosphate isomerase